MHVVTVIDVFNVPLVKLSDCLNDGTAIFRVDRPFFDSGLNYTELEALNQEEMGLIIKDFLKNIDFLNENKEQICLSTNACDDISMSCNFIRNYIDEVVANKDQYKTYVHILAPCNNTLSKMINFDSVSLNSEEFSDAFTQISDSIAETAIKLYLNSETFNCKNTNVWLVDEVAAEMHTSADLYSKHLRIKRVLKGLIPTIIKEEFILSSDIEHELTSCEEEFNHIKQTLTDSNFQMTNALSVSGNDVEKPLFDSLTCQRANPSVLLQDMLLDIEKTSVFFHSLSSNIIFFTEYDKQYDVISKNYNEIQASIAENKSEMELNTYNFHSKFNSVKYIVEKMSTSIIMNEEKLLQLFKLYFKRYNKVFHSLECYGDEFYDFDESRYNDMKRFFVTAESKMSIIFELSQSFYDFLEFIFHSLLNDNTTNLDMVLTIAFIFVINVQKYVSTLFSFEQNIQKGSRLYNYKVVEKLFKLILIDCESKAAFHRKFLNKCFSFFETEAKEQPKFIASLNLLKRSSDDLEHSISTKIHEKDNYLKTYEKLDSLVVASENNIEQYQDFMLSPILLHSIDKDLFLASIMNLVCNKIQYDEDEAVNPIINKPEFFANIKSYNKGIENLNHHNKTAPIIVDYLESLSKTFLTWNEKLVQTLFDFKLLVTSKNDLLLANLVHYINFYDKWTLLLVRQLKAATIMQPFTNMEASDFVYHLLRKRYEEYMQTRNLIQMLVHSYFNGKLHQDWEERFIKFLDVDLLDSLEGITSVDILDNDEIDNSDVTAVSIAILAYLNENLETFDDAVHMAMRRRTKIDNEQLHLTKLSKFMNSLDDVIDKLNSTVLDITEKLQNYSEQLLHINEKKALISFYQTKIELAYHNLEKIRDKNCSKHRMLNTLVSLKEAHDSLPDDALFIRLKELLDKSISEMSESSDISRTSIELTCKIEYFNPVVDHLKGTTDGLFNQRLSTSKCQLFAENLDNILKRDDFKATQEIVDSFEGVYTNSSAKKKMLCLKNNLAHVESTINAMKERICEFNNFDLGLQEFVSKIMDEITEQDEILVKFICDASNKLLPTSLEGLFEIYDKIKANIFEIQKDIDDFGIKLKLMSEISDEDVYATWTQRFNVPSNRLENLVDTMENFYKSLQEKVTEANKLFTDVCSNEKIVVSLEKMTETLRVQMYSDVSSVSSNNEVLKETRNILDKCKTENLRLEEELINLASANDLGDDNADFDQFKSAIECLKVCTQVVQNDIDFIMKKHMSDLIMDNRESAVSNIEEMRDDISKKVEFFIGNISKCLTQNCLEDFRGIIKCLKNNLLQLERECKVYKSICDSNTDTPGVDASINLNEKLFHMVDTVKREVLKVRRIFKYQEDMSESYMSEYQEHLDDIDKLVEEYNDLSKLKKQSTENLEHIDTNEFKKQLKELKLHHATLVEPLVEQALIELPNNDSKEKMQFMEDKLAKLETLAESVSSSLVPKVPDTNCMFDLLDNLCSDLNKIELSIALCTSSIDLEECKHKLDAHAVLLSSQSKILENVDAIVPHSFNKLCALIDQCEDKIFAIRSNLNDNSFENDSVSSADFTPDDANIVNDLMMFGNTFENNEEKGTSQYDLTAFIMDERLAYNLVDKLTCISQGKKEASTKKDVVSAHESFWNFFKKWGTKELKIGEQPSASVLDSFEAWINNLETLHNKFELNVYKQRRYCDRDLTCLKKEITRLNSELVEREAFQDYITRYYNVHGYKCPSERDRFHKLNNSYYKLRDSVKFMHYFLQKYNSSLNNLEKKIEVFDKLLDKIEVPSLTTPVDYMEFSNLQENQRKSEELIKQLEGKLKLLHYELNVESRSLFSTDKTLGNKGLRLKLNLCEKKFNRIKNFAGKINKKINNCIEGTNFDLKKMDEFSKELTVREKDSKRFLEFDYSFNYSSDERIALEHARFIANLLKLKKEYNHILTRQKYLPIRNANCLNFSNIAKKHLARWDTLFKALKNCTPIYDQLKRSRFENCTNKPLNWPVWRDGFVKNLKQRGLKVKDIWPKEANNKGFSKLSQGLFVSTLAKTKYNDLYVGVNEIFQILSRNGRKVDCDDFLDLINGKEEKPTLKMNDPKDVAAYIDSHLDSIMMACTCDIPFVIKRIEKDKIIVGPKKKLMLIRLMRCKVMARVGGGWIELNEHLSKLDQCRMVRKNQGTEECSTPDSNHNVDDFYMKALDALNISGSSTSSDYSSKN